MYIFHPSFGFDDVNRGLIQRHSVAEGVNSSAGWRTQSSPSKIVEVEMSTSSSLLASVSGKCPKHIIFFGAKRRGISFWHFCSWLTFPSGKCWTNL